MNEIYRPRRKPTSDQFQGLNGSKSNFGEMPTPISQGSRLGFLSLSIPLFCLYSIVLRSVFLVLKNSPSPFYRLLILRCRLTYFASFLNTSTLEIPTLLCTWSLKKVPSLRWSGIHVICNNINSDGVVIWYRKFLTCLRLCDCRLNWAAVSRRPCKIRSYKEMRALLVM